MKVFLVSISNLFCNPNLDRAMNAEAAAKFLLNPDDYNKTAKEWTQKYAEKN